MGFRGVPTLGPAERSVVVGTSRSSWHSPTTCGSSSRRSRIRGVLLEEEAEPTGPSVGATASWDPASQMVPANVPDSPLRTVSAVLSATSAQQSAGDSTLPSVRRCLRTTWVTRLAGCGTRGNMKAGLSSWGRSRLANQNRASLLARPQLTVGPMQKYRATPAALPDSRTRGTRARTLSRLSDCSFGSAKGRSGSRRPGSPGGDKAEVRSSAAVFAL